MPVLGDLTALSVFSAVSSALSLIASPKSWKGCNELHVVCTLGQIMQHGLPLTYLCGFLRFFNRVFGPGKHLELSQGYVNTTLSMAPSSIAQPPLTCRCSGLDRVNTGSLHGLYPTACCTGVARVQVAHAGCMVMRAVDCMFMYECNGM